MSDQSRIEQELSDTQMSYDSRIEEFIAWLKEDVPTHPEPRSRIEEQLASMVPGGGSATLVEKSINQNGTYKASDDNADGYSKVSVEVPEPRLGPKTITLPGYYIASFDHLDGYSEITTEGLINDPTTEPKTITANGEYNPGDEDLDYYETVTVDVPQNGYFGIPVAKTAADVKHLVFETFSTEDYAINTILAVAMEAAANDNRFDIDSYTVDSSSGGVPTGITLTYGSAEPKVYAYDSSYAAMRLNNLSDYARIRKSEPYETAYLISSKAMLISSPVGDYDFTTYGVFALGRDIINDAKSAWWNYQYQSTDYLEVRGCKIGSAGAKQEQYVAVTEIGDYVSLSPLRTTQYTPTTFIDGLFKVDFGPPGLNGFYEIGGQLFYISAGIAIKDE